MPHYAPAMTDSPNLHDVHPAQGIAGALTTTADIDAVIRSALPRGLEGGALASQGPAFCAGTGGGVLQTDGLILALTGRVHHGDATSVDAVLQALARDYRRQGTAALTSLKGAFALAILEPEHGRGLLAVDKIGIRQLYYAQDGTGLSFCTALAPLVEAGLGGDLDAQAIHDYVYCHFIPSPRSIYQGIRKLPGGHVLEWERGTHRVHPYWLPRFEETPVDVAGSGREMLAIIEQAVRDAAAAPEAPRTAAFLSGGLDSSTVTGMLARVSDEAHAYSIGFDVPGYDEMEYARLARGHFGAVGHEYYVTPDDITTWLPHVAAACDEPFGNSSVLPAFLCARKAREEGVDLLLAGDGGDELFAGNERYAKQGVFEHFNRLPSWARQTLIAGTAPLAPLPLLRKAHSYVSQARIPLPDRMDTYAFLERHDPREVFAAGFIDTVDLHAPRDLKRGLFAAPEGASLLNRMLYLDWHFTLHDNDLVKVNTACRLAGVEVAYPMLAEDLMMLSNRIPSAQKLKGNQLRWFYKQACRDFLPEAIIHKKKHGFGLPFGIWLRDHPPLRDLALDALTRLKGRDIIRPEFIDELIRLHRDKHAAYYGELVWVLMVLELWLAGRRHSPL
ncbi:asparagine synthetase B family protein [Ectothiorhodospira lacustris]|uniref:asparagine synthetase B family protein n=1 Tax=Ectothiorhodospira lacustris TaxID=2899127 RepID=UPI001EE95217|nr:asparagine synthase-related protein [Ectothiorhodospira lacustris]MCG5510332.1 asparagine synthase [Ectothiorhodospira lacustris]MCG5522078.1 asparagine synthase [Ectothiorhodospira lacustris]